MGLFDKMFKSERDIVKEEIEKIPWKYITEEQDIEELEKQSFSKPVIIFKYSTRCGISRITLRKFENDLPENMDVAFYFMDLVKYRSLSNEIAERFKVSHESPQLIVLKEGKVLHHSSHQDIHAKRLSEYI
ncbi:MAG: bacillithiol system redox-active protein YtxJ [Salegentibacter sp.]|uniref:Bacillithiol system protein YtxJ n=1 Tax=Salegentibacter flavus TaxID=287099 RepID=A0A1I5DE16_9FLAO|nr:MULTISPECIES: bacillithiol system redox-active protein YtxJ [Salegentibacter]MDR9456990.1 bacillithiol system redox-active protein YtxJ [Salegentibacter sp.]SFN97386.1 bacillithiol system protein YtxJ [Salegentibacter flavus]